MEEPIFLNRKIDQLGFVTENIYQTMEEYHKKFGIDNWNIYTYGPQNLSFMFLHGKPASFEFRLALSDLGETRIEIIQNLKNETIYTEFITNRGYGLQHLGIYVQDIKSEIIKAQNIGYLIYENKIRFGFNLIHNKISNYEFVKVNTLS